MRQALTGLALSEFARSVPEDGRQEQLGIVYRAIEREMRESLESGNTFIPVISHETERMFKRMADAEA